MRTLKRSIWPAVLSLTVVATAVVGGATVSQPAAATPAPAPVVSERVEEDAPGFDCRFDGNKLCGVKIKGEWHVISYDESGNPVSVHPRGA